MTIKNNENLTAVSFEERQGAKRPFFEPEISEAVDVLEATAFFQVVTGGGLDPIGDDAVIP